MDRRPAIYTIAAALSLDAIMGVLFSAVEHIAVLTGLYWAVITATTIGYGDVVPRTHAGRVLAIVVALTVVPLFAATFSLFTSALTTRHVKRHVQDSETEIKRHVEERLRHHLGYRVAPPAGAAGERQEPASGPGQATDTGGTAPSG